MANLLVLVELTDGSPLPGSLEALGQARRIGSALGATVYAVVPCAEAPGYGDDDLIAVLSRHGADKILLSTDKSYGGPARFGTHGPFVMQACAALVPSLLLAATSEGSRDLAPRVAARLGAAFLADGWVDVAGDRLALFEGSGSTAHRLDDDDLEFPVVALLPPGRYATATGDDEAEVEVFGGLPPFSGDFEELDAIPSATANVSGAGPAAQALRDFLDGSAPPATPRLLLELLPAQLPDEPAGATRVAIGPHACDRSNARYALDGETDALAAALTTALTVAAVARPRATAPDPPATPTNDPDATPTASPQDDPSTDGKSESA